MTEQETREIQNEAEIRKTDPAWAIVCEFMWHNGMHHEVLTIWEMHEVYERGNGLGDLPKTKIPSSIGDVVRLSEKIKSLLDWDWTHIRDSSRAGVLRMENAIQTALGRKKLRAVYIMPNEREHYGGARVILKVLSF